MSACTGLLQTFALSVRKGKQQTPTLTPCTYTADLIVSKGCIGGIHHHDKFHLGIGHIAVSARLVKEHALAQGLYDCIWHTQYHNQEPASLDNFVNPHKLESGSAQAREAMQQLCRN